jgi:hypothetical protein
MYEPVWFFKKSLTAVAEAIAAVIALTGYLRLRQSAISSAANH